RCSARLALRDLPGPFSAAYPDRCFREVGSSCFGFSTNRREKEGRESNSPRCPIAAKHQPWAWRSAVLLTARACADTQILTSQCLETRLLVWRLPGAR